MPRKLIFFFLFIFFIDLSFASRVTFAQNNDPKTIKFGSFTPPPTRTPSVTPPITVTITQPTITPTAMPLPIDGGTNNTLKIAGLVEEIRRYCTNGIVTNSNLACVDGININQARKPVVVSELKLSALGFRFLQCVGFVRAATALLFGAPLNNGGNAIDYATNIPDGFALIENFPGIKIKAEDIPIWNYDTYGHIAYVTKVFDSNTFQVAEANLGSPGLVRLYITTKDNPKLVGWLRKI